jgi:hypothetical protein
MGLTVYADRQGLDRAKGGEPFEANLFPSWQHQHQLSVPLDQVEFAEYTPYGPYNPDKVVVRPAQG